MNMHALGVGAGIGREPVRRAADIRGRAPQAAADRWYR